MNATTPDPDHTATRFGRRAHQLGYRGHIATKSRAYFTPLRAEHRRVSLDLPESVDDIVTDAVWSTPDRATPTARAFRRWHRRRLRAAP